MNNTNKSSKLKLAEEVIKQHKLSFAGRLEINCYVHYVQVDSKYQEMTNDYIFYVAEYKLYQCRYILFISVIA